MASANEIARYIVGLFHEAQEPVTNLKLQNLLYYLQGWSIAISDRPAFAEPLLAGEHGPLVASVYEEYAHYRWNPIGEAVAMPCLEDDLVELIKEVLEAYGGESAYALQIRTHHERPWLEAREIAAAKAAPAAEISAAAMKLTFKCLAEKTYLQTPAAIRR